GKGVIGSMGSGEGYGVAVECTRDSGFGQKPWGKLVLVWREMGESRILGVTAGFFSIDLTLHFWTFGLDFAPLFPFSFNKLIKPTKLGCRKPQNKVPAIDLGLYTLGSPSPPFILLGLCKIAILAIVLGYGGSGGGEGCLTMGF
ncbi:hypothetical protein Tco_1298136, partial [Tanacetum coccineum]